MDHWLVLFGGNGDILSRPPFFDPSKTYNDLYLMDLRPPPANRSWVGCALLPLV